MMIINILYYLLMILIIASSLSILVTQNTFYAVLYLLVTLIGFAGIYLLQGAALVAILNLVIQGGGILLMMLFSFMLLHIDNSPPSKHTQQRLIVLFVILLTMGLATSFYFSIKSFFLLSPSKQFPTENAAVSLGLQLVGPYALALELTSIILLVALVGAVYIARGQPAN